VRFCYADPPYVGQAKRHYGKPEVDHAVLLQSLYSDFPDGWALSCSSSSLRALLALCDDSVRVLAWVKPFAVFKPYVNPAYAWEPVILRGGRRRGRDMPTIRDWLSCNITLRRGLAGAKPAAFAHWICDVLNVQKGDVVVDLFPGTGGCGEIFTGRVA
jgi:hypothetical protein